MPEYIQTYAHGDGRIGVLLELACRDWATLRTDEFKSAARYIAMHIAASRPASIAPDDLDPSLWERELGHINRALTGADSTTRQARVKKMRDDFEKNFCLLKQIYFRDSSMSVEQFLSGVSSSLSDEIRIIRFVRYEANAA